MKATTVEVYSGSDLLTTKAVSNGNIAAALSSVNVGLDAYKNSKQVTVKVYVADEKEAVYEMTAAVNPVSIEDGSWNVFVSSLSGIYNGNIQVPLIEVKNSAGEKASWYC